MQEMKPEGHPDLAVGTGAPAKSSPSGRAGFRVAHRPAFE